MFPGFSSRMEKELKEIFVEQLFDGDKSGLLRLPIKVRDPPRRKHSVFMGASFLAKSSPEQRWVSRQALLEGGEKVLFSN